MSRHIDADKLQETFKELHGGKRSLLIDTEPTADVVEVVRCKDCKSWNDVELQVDGINHKCWGGCEFWKYQTDANDYCSQGERADK